MQHIDCRKQHWIKTDLPAFIMGIVNATPDSFYEPSRSAERVQNMERALKLEAEGADIIDIGGESTRPGAAYVNTDEELERVIPLIEAIRQRSAVPISVDTRKAAVMQAAFKAGAEMCNDISALSDDPALGMLIAAEEGSVVLMHKQGVPQSMQNAPQYKDCVAEVCSYLAERAAYAVRCGIAPHRIILDYGIGFGKTVEDNYRLIAAGRSFTALGYPLLAGLSRKSFIGAVSGAPPEGRLAGSIAAALYAVQNGAAIIRVHDVAETQEMLLVLKELQKYGTN
ncbi:dihydropteroate synthase [Treponema sp.]|uniref:dihydropteroate synthase n=1 Tax=Treponema sp. TaxID=166 RepID=UPI003FA2AE05